jgi:hypothetical protein
MNAKGYPEGYSEILFLKLGRNSEHFRLQRGYVAVKDRVSGKAPWGSTPVIADEGK